MRDATHPHRSPRTRIEHPVLVRPKFSRIGRCHVLFASIDPLSRPPYGGAPPCQPPLSKEGRLGDAELDEPKLDEPRLDETNRDEADEAEEKGLVA